MSNPVDHHSIGEGGFFYSPRSPSYSLFLSPPCMFVIFCFVFVCCCCCFFCGGGSDSLLDPNEGAISPFSTPFSFPSHIFVKGFLSSHTHTPKRKKKFKNKKFLFKDCWKLKEGGKEKAMGRVGESTGRQTRCFWASCTGGRGEKGMPHLSILLSVHPSRTHMQEGCYYHTSPFWNTYIFIYFIFFFFGFWLLFFRRLRRGKNGS